MAQSEYRIIRIREDFPSSIKKTFINAGRDPVIAELFAEQLLSLGEPESDFIKSNVLRIIQQSSPWMDVKEAAAYAKRSEKSIYRWIESGDLPAYYPDSKPLIKQSDLDRFIQRRGDKK